VDKEFLPKTLALLKQWLEEEDKDENRN